MARNHIDEALKLADTAYKAGKVFEADKYYSIIIKIEKDHAQANYNLGVLMSSLGKIKVASKFFRKAVASDITNLEFWLRYIDLQAELGELNSINSLLFNLQESFHDKKHLDHLQRKIREKKTKYIAETSTESRATSEIIRRLSKLYYEKKYKVVVAEAQTFVSSSPYSSSPRLSFVWNILGSAYTKLTKTPDAVDAFKRAIKCKPDFSEAYYNLGSVFQQKGKLEEAENAFRNAVLCKPSHAEAHFNLGTILKQLDKLEQAYTAYTQFISIKRDEIERYSFLGSILSKKGRLDEALEICKKAVCHDPENEMAYLRLADAYFRTGNLKNALVVYDKALLIEPDLIEALIGRGLILKNQGKYEEAKLCFAKALRTKQKDVWITDNEHLSLGNNENIDEILGTLASSLSNGPSLASAYNDASIALYRQGKLQDSIKLLMKAIAAQPVFDIAYMNLGVMLKNGKFQKPNLEIEELLVRMLQQQTNTRPQDIANAVISLLKMKPYLAHLLSFQKQQNIDSLLEKYIVTISNNRLLLNLMKVCPVPDLSFEEVLKKIRSFCLFRATQENINFKLLGLQSALASQCFVNEYIYSKSISENEALMRLELKTKAKLLLGEQPSPEVILALASYKALSEYSFCHLIENNADLIDVFRTQITEPAQEKEIQSTIPSFSIVRDTVSSKVQEQYEENPYPRWINTALLSKPVSLVQMFQESGLRIPCDKIAEVKRPKILIAGCGTGQHPLLTASTVLNSEIVAIDLSLNSLSYAKRKSKELGFKNIEFMQGDILDVQKLNMKFDIIESVGVLHHMADPLAGWQSLRDCLRPSGLMKIGLYSASARFHIAQIRRDIEKRKIKPTRSAMKTFRENAVSSGDHNYQLILQSNDFYNLSELRDLLFHAQEHHFSILKIETFLHKLGLKFCGFDSDRNMQKFKQEFPKKNDMYNLKNWHIFEQNNSFAFSRMYQFWCQNVG